MRERGGIGARYRRLGAALVVAVVVAALSSLFWRRLWLAVPLLWRADKVACLRESSAWRAGPAWLRDPEHIVKQRWWLTDGRVISVEFTHGMRPTRIRVTYTRTGRCVELGRMVAAAGRSDGTEFLPSFDGRRALVRMRADAPGGEAWFCVTDSGEVAGPFRSDWASAPWPTRAAWSTDNRHWAELGYGGASIAVAVRDFGSGALVARAVVPVPPEFGGTYGRVSLVGASRLSVLRIAPRSGVRPVVQTVQCEMGRIRLASCVQRPCPGAHLADGVALSPDGSQFALATVAPRRASSVPAWLLGLLGIDDGDTPNRTSIWRGACAGSRVEKIGDVPTSINGSSVSDTSRYVGGLEWLPGTQRISFYYGPDTYTVDAD